ncbi:hypothetical protein KSP40_PGU003042 [Platanthera guangdongensis]|uniref:Uncharacterized protein n=1 Tax=Platanthera guangdongensis TaxID=2320717 RepID=A0ABR2LPB9_9ASPA
MGYLRRISTLLGFLRNDTSVDEVDDDSRAGESASCRPLRGFSAQAGVALQNPDAGPVVVSCSIGEGGVQGFRWYSRRLLVDDDGDVADEFLDEVSPIETSCMQELAAYSRFEIKSTARPARVRKLAFTMDGNIHPRVEYHGMLRLV